MVKGLVSVTIKNARFNLTGQRLVLIGECVKTNTIRIFNKEVVTIMEHHVYLKGTCTVYVLSWRHGAWISAMAKTPKYNHILNQIPVQRIAV